MQYSAKISISQASLPNEDEITGTFKLIPVQPCDRRHLRLPNRLPSVRQLSFDERVQQLCERGDYQTAAHRLLETHGSDIRAFLYARTRNRDLADEVFSVFSEDLCKGLPGFAFRGKARSWMFTIARHALARHMNSRSRWHAVHTPLQQEDDAVGHAGVPRHEAALRQRLRQLIKVLPEQDRFLLRQRVALAKDWRAIARTQLADAIVEDAAALDRESARLRKRYQLLVGRLREALQQSELGDWP